MKKKHFKISYKITIMVILMVTVCSLSVGIFVYDIVEQNYYRLKGETAQAAAQTLAASLDQDAIHTLIETEEEDQYYRNLKMILGKASGKIPGLAFLYIITVDNTDVKIVYGQDGDGGFQLTLGYREPLDIWNEASKRSFETAALAYSQPYEADFYGKLVSGYAPIVDENGESIAIVGLDLSLEDILEELKDNKISILWISLVFILLFAIISFVYTKRSIGNPVTKLSILSNEIANGNIGGDIKVKTNDELGLLSANFGRMQTTISDLRSDIRDIVKNAANGVLGCQIQKDKYPGAWSEVFVELNHLLDTVRAPIDEVADKLHRIADGQFDTQITSEYKGDFIRIKESVNSTAIGISQYFAEKILAEHAASRAKMEKERAEAVSEAMMSSIRYASKIQRNLLPAESIFKDSFADYSVIWKPRDIVGGDIYWLKQFEEGTVLCVCDCTGHGTPGALLTMLVVSALEASVEPHNCHDTAEIIWKLEQRLVDIFGIQAEKREIGQIKDGCDLAVLYIAKGGDVLISAAQTNVFLCNGEEVKRIRGQKIFVGEGKLKSKEEIETIHVPANPDNKFYIASDGLFDQPGGEYSRCYGYKNFTKIILENHAENQGVISEQVWDAFEKYRGTQQRVDDFELISFKPI